ncbi:MAG: hypothetical protein RLZZ500_2595 [Bacteroidota bacterium]|jgi:hypothetical protein
MKITGIVIRILFGGLMVFASIAYFFQLVDAETPTDAVKTMNDGFMATQYLFPLVKAIELLCGIGLLFNKFPRLTPLVLFPISINIFLVHLFIDRPNLAIGFFVLGANFFLLVQQRVYYRELFKWNA